MRLLALIHCLEYFHLEALNEGYVGLANIGSRGRWNAAGHNAARECDMKLGKYIARTLVT